MGRKKKEKYERRDRYLKVRISESEYDDLVILSEMYQCSMSEFVRNLVKNEMKKFTP